MNIVIAIDSFKGSLTSMEVGEAVARGILQADPNSNICVRPLADGGEGTVDALICGLGGQRESISVSGPLGEPVSCSYGIIGEHKTAVMEMSAAAGLTLVPDQKRNPFYTTTYGVGEMIKDAISKGCRRFIIGIGGSATNDGGVGMLQALGYGFWDKQDNPIPRGAIGLSALHTITTDQVLPELSECHWRKNSSQMQIL